MRPGHFFIYERFGSRAHNRNCVLIDLSSEASFKRALIDVQYMLIASEERSETPSSMIS